MRHIALLLMTVVTTVSCELQCAAGKPEKVNGVMKCPIPVTTLFNVDSSLTPREVIYPLYSKGVHYKEGDTTEIPTCKETHECYKFDYLSDKYTYRGICSPAQDKRTRKIIGSANYCFAVRETFMWEHYIEYFKTGMRHCSSNLDCKTTEPRQELDYDGWYCDKQVEFYNLDRKPVYGVCMKVKLCFGEGQSLYASRPLNGESCNLNDHSTCAGAGYAAKDKSKEYTPKCVPYTFKGSKQDTNLCCQNYVPKCAKGSLTIKGLTYYCDPAIEQPSCSAGVDFYPKTSCQSNKDCSKLAKNNLVCDPQHKKCCDVTVPSYLSQINVDRLVAILTNQTSLISFYSTKSPVLAAEFQKEFSLSFNATTTKQMLDSHNRIRESIARGTFSIHGEKLPAARNMKTLKWNTKFEAHAKVAALKSCAQKLDEYNMEVFGKDSPIDINSGPEQYGLQTVQNWEHKLKNHANFMTHDESEVIAIVDDGIGESLLQMIHDGFSEVGCAFTRCAPYGKNTPTVACYYGTTAKLSFVYQFAK